MIAPLPIISIIITTYNSQAFIQRLLNSIFNQQNLKTHFNIELIIVDDCSTDTTTEIIKSNNLKYYSTNKNSGGPNKGRNIGLKNVTGDFICIVDHDDEWHPNKLNSILPYLNKTLIITSGFTTCDIATNKKFTKVNRSSDDKPFLFFETNETFLNILTRNGKGQNNYLGSTAYSSKLKHILFEEVHGMIDFDWGLKLFQNQSSIEICDSLYTRYVSETNLSKNENYRLKDYDYSMSIVQEYKELYPKEVSISVKKMNGSLARYYYLSNNMKKARHYFLKSEFNLKTFFYYITTFVGSKFVKRKFNVFG